MHAKSLQSLCPTLCNPMDYSPPGSSVHGILRQEHGSGLPCPPPEIFWTQGLNPCLLWLLYCKQILYHWATREAYIYIYRIYIYSLPLEPPSYPIPYPCLLGGHRLPGWAPCVIEQLPWAPCVIYISYPLYTLGTVYMSRLPSQLGPSIRPTLSFP